MAFVYSALGLMLVLMAFSQWYLIVCADLIDRKRIDAPKPIPWFFTRETKKFCDFVLLGRHRTSSNAAVLRAFGRFRALLIAQLLLFTANFIYVIAAL